MNRMVFSSVAMAPRVLTAGIGLLLGAAAALTLALRAQAQSNPVPAAAPAAAKPAAPSPALNPNPVPAATMAHSCAACHGTLGQLGDESFKPLAGMPVSQFVRTMAEFREGKRPSTLMGHVAKGFTDADFKAMGEFFAAQPAPAIVAAAKGVKP